MKFLFGLRGMNVRVKIKAAIVFLSVLAVAAGCASGNKKHFGVVIAQSDKYAASLFRQNCAICHGKEAYGKMLNGKPVPSLRSGDAAKRSEQEIYNQIKNGKLPMPAFKSQMSESEIRQMVEFVMVDLQGRKESQVKVLRDER